MPWFRILMAGLFFSGAKATLLQFFTFGTREWSKIAVLGITGWWNAIGIIPWAFSEMP